MMAMSDNRPLGGADETPRFRKILLSVLMVTIILFSAGAVAGATIAMLDGSAEGAKAPIMVLVALMALAAAGYGLVRLKPWAGSGEPMSPKTRKANNLLMLSGAIGAVIGGALAISTIRMEEPFGLFSNGALSAAVVIPILIVWLVLVPLISWQWHRNVDEHEANAYQFGALYAIYLYAFLAPAWWLAWRGGLVPEPDTMVVYLIVLTVWSLGWFWRRYR